MGGGRKEEGVTGMNEVGGGGVEGRGEGRTSSRRNVMED